MSDDHETFDLPKKLQHQTSPPRGPVVSHGLGPVFVEAQLPPYFVITQEYARDILVPVMKKLEMEGEIDDIQRQPGGAFKIYVVPE